MENVNTKGKLRGKKFVWFERMMRREGRKLCAVALCASMIIGNMAWPAAAAGDTSGEYSFELTSESLFNAIQDAIAEGTVVDTDLELKGSAADEYQSFLEAGSSLYEIEPVIENSDSDRDKVLDLRAFVRLENDIELDSAYVMDGSEEITFLLVNSSDVYQQATISVDGRESETITVLPTSAVAVDEEEVGPGVSGTANNISTTVTGSGSGSSSSGGSGGSGSNNADTDTTDDTLNDESETTDTKTTDIETADIVIENNNISSGLSDSDSKEESIVEVLNEENSDDDAQEPEESEGSAEGQQDNPDPDGEIDDTTGTENETENDSDPDEISDPVTDDRTSDGENADGDTTEGEPEDSSGAGDTESSSEEKAGEAGADESGNDNTAENQDDDSEEEANDNNTGGEVDSYVSAASAISAHITYLVAVSATPADAEEATPSDASYGLNGETYETVLLSSKAAAAYVTTAEELELDKIETILYTAELEDVVFSVEVPVGALPWGVELKASEYEKDSETYLSRYAETVDLIDELDEEEDYTETIRLFNVGFYDADGVEVEPTEKVNVTITYLDADAEDVGQVVHFGEEETEVIDVKANYDADGNKNVSYELESFSDIAAIASSDDGISLAATYSGYTVTVNGTTTISSSDITSATSGTWSSSDTTIATVSRSGNTITITGVAEGTTTITHTYTYQKQSVTDTYTVTVSNTVAVYVFVSGFVQGSNPKEYYSDDMLELLNVNTLDGYGYFAAGVIYLDMSKFSSSSTTSRITTEEEWDYVISVIKDYLHTNYSETCPDNLIAQYAEQIIKDIGYKQGNGYSGLWLAGGHSNITDAGGEVNGQYWHLDIRFETVKITYIYGENGITEADSSVAYDGNTAGSKVFIKGATMDYTPTIEAPDGWKIVGYYTTSDFQEGTEWDAVGQPIDKDTTVYIKIVPEDDVVINYVVAEGVGTVTNPSNNDAEAQSGYENFNPTTGSPVGSTATAGEGYEFEGWYSDAALTIKVSSDAKYTPSKPGGGWTEGAEYTYYAKFVPIKTSVTVNKVWKDNTSSLRPESITIELYAGEEATGTTAELTGSDGWTYTFTDINKYSYNDDGTVIEEISYTVKEDEVVNYTSSVATNEDGSITVTNTHYEADTGIRLDSAPYIRMLIGLLLFGAVAFIRRRRTVL